MKTRQNRKLGLVNRVLMTAFFLVFACCFMAGCDGDNGGGKDDDGGPFLGGEGTGADGITTFWRYFGEYTTNDWGTNFAVDLSNDGGFLVAGERWSRPDLGGDYSAVDARDFIIFKADEKGIIEWRTTEHNPEVEEILYDVKQTADGGAIAVGTLKEGDDLYALAIKVDSAGEVEWKKTFDGGGTHFNEARAVCVLDDGYAIAGATHSEVGVREFYFWFFKIDLNGNKINDSERLPVLRAGARAMDKIDGGGFILAGQARYAVGGPTPHLHIARLDENGDPLWSRYYGTGFAEAVRSVGQNGFIVAGTTSQYPWTPDHNKADGRVLRIDSEGDVIWDRVLGGSDGDTFNGVGITASGNFIAAGFTRSYTDSYGRPNIFLAKLDKNGNLLWQKAKGKKMMNEDAGHAMAMTPDGGFVVAGRGPNTFVKFDRNGDTVKLDDVDFSYTVVEGEGYINMMNAADIAIAAADAVIIPFRFGAMPTDLLLDTLGGITAEWCKPGGSFQWEPLPQALPDLNGRSLLLTFSTCEIGSIMDPIILNGSLSITMKSVSGGLATDNYEMETIIDPINISVTDNMGSTEYSGGLAYNRESDAGNLTEQVIIKTKPLTISDSNTLTFLQIDLSATRQASGALTIGTAGEKGLFDTDRITGLLAIRVELPVAINAMDVPTAGKLRVLAQDNSSLFMTFDNGFVDIEVDTNGNGEIDDTMRIKWD